MNKVIKAVRGMDKQMGVILFLLVVITIVMALDNPYFLTVHNFTVMAEGFLFEGIMALAMTLVIVSGGIDISAGVFPLSAILMALMVRSGYNYYLAMLIAI